MAIRYFIFSIFILSIATLFIGNSSKNEESNKEEKPNFIFDNSKLYTISKDGLQRIVEAKETLFYPTKEEAFGIKATIKTSNNTIFDTIHSDYALKELDIITFRDNVEFYRDDFISLKTEEAYYNTKNKEAYNNTAFSGFYYEHTIQGDSFLTKDNYFIQAKNTIFNINLKD